MVNERRITEMHMRTKMRKPDLSHWPDSERHFIGNMSREEADAEIYACESYIKKYRSILRVLSGRSMKLLMVLLGIMVGALVALLVTVFPDKTPNLRTLVVFVVTSALVSVLALIVMRFIRRRVRTELGIAQSRLDMHNNTIYAYEYAQRKAREEKLPDDEVATQSNDADEAFARMKMEPVVEETTEEEEGSEMITEMTEVMAKQLMDTEQEESMREEVMREEAEQEEIVTEKVASEGVEREEVLREESEQEEMAEQEEVMQKEAEQEELMQEEETLEEEAYKPFEPRRLTLAELLKEVNELAERA